MSRDGLTLDPANSQRIRDWPVPRSVTAVRAFLGLCSYYRRFVYKYAFISQPLHRLTQKQVPFEWTDECATAFQTLKDALTSPPIMAFPNFDQPFILSTDASNYAVGAVLSQTQNGLERVVAYASHVLTRTERRWSTYDKELWAIVWAVRHFRHYLSCNPFTIITDHRPLLSLRKADVTQDRWALELDPYQWTVVHKEGKKHINADAMSRIPLLQQTSELEEAAMTPALEVNVTPQICPMERAEPTLQVENSGMDFVHHTLSDQDTDILAAQLSDPTLAEVYSWVQDNK